MPENNLPILNWLLTTNPEPASGTFESVVHWKHMHAEQLLSWTKPVDMAIAGGFLSDCPAYAFAVGYWAALQRLLPDLPKTPVPALCISEKEGPHPAKIKCRLEKTGDRWRLNGKKHFVTCGREADLLLVAASTGTGPDSKNRLRLVRVEKSQSGMTVSPLDKPLAILPEISHGAVAFNDVAVSDTAILPGDGYQAYIKPFRTIEDLHVIAALLGYLLRIGTLYDWPTSAKERLVALLLAARATARDDFTAPAVHIAVGGVIETLRALLKQLEGHWDTVDPQTHHAWQRDRSVLDIAADARRKRLAAAWRHFFESRIT
ncbi:MAG: acyl-CoA dehydrogenase [Desulfobacterales bacterium]|nr:acyl-CoA dehydrogenase [Desulfobacterales bacterium]